LDPAWDNARRAAVLRGSSAWDLCRCAAHNSRSGACQRSWPQGSTAGGRHLWTPGREPAPQTARPHADQRRAGSCP